MPCSSFGDGTPKEKTSGPRTQHKYENPGQYAVVVEVEDKHRQKATAMVNQRVSPDPEFSVNQNEQRKTNPARTGLTEYHLPPYVGLKSTPSNAKPKEQVLLDAAESMDYKGGPPVSYSWDFGDGTPVLLTKKPKVNHAYAEPGSYPVKCTVLDRFGQTGDAGL